MSHHDGRLALALLGAAALVTSVPIARTAFAQEKGPCRTNGSENNKDAGTPGLCGCSATCTADTSAPVACESVVTTGKCKSASCDNIEGPCNRYQYTCISMQKRTCEGNCIFGDPNFPGCTEHLCKDKGVTIPGQPLVWVCQ